MEVAMLMPIGRFSRASRLSIKSLRRYDESGLLPAAFVDPDSGYRYYRAEQLARAGLIRFLRIAGMPVSDIVEVLEGDDPGSLLEAHLESMERRRGEIDRLAHQLRQRIERRDYPMSAPVRIETTEATTAVSYRTATSYPEIFDDIPNGFDRVMTHLNAHNVVPAGPPFTVYHQVTDADTPGDIAMCVPVVKAPPIDGGLEILELAAGLAATVIHRGGYDDLSAAYEAVAGWIHERGHRIAGPHREVYLNSPIDTAEQDLLTQILFPVDDEEQP